MHCLPCLHAVHPGDKCAQRWMQTDMQTMTAEACCMLCTSAHVLGLCLMQTDRHYVFHCYTHCYIHCHTDCYTVIQTVTHAVTLTGIHTVTQTVTHIVTQTVTQTVTHAVTHAVTHRHDHLLPDTLAWLVPGVDRKGANFC